MIFDLEDYIENLVAQSDMEDLSKMIEKYNLRRPQMDDGVILDGSTRRGVSDE